MATKMAAMTKTGPEQIANKTIRINWLPPRQPYRLIPNDLCITTENIPRFVPQYFTDENAPFRTTSTSYFSSRVLNSGRLKIAHPLTEPAISAVTAKRKLVTYWNQGERMAPFSALKNLW